MTVAVIAEKPSVARDIARVLGAVRKGDGCLYGNGYTVSWALGHLVALPEPHEIDPSWKKWRRDLLPMLPKQWPLKVLPKTRAQFRVVERILRDAAVEQVICATDAGREGELIFRYVYEKARCRKPVKRLWISSLTPAAIRQGMDRLKSGAAYDNLAAAARGRSQADWLVGMNLSRAYTLAGDEVYSVGRVQTPTLAMLVDRTEAIRSFVPEDYLEVVASFSMATGTYLGVFFDEKTKTRLPPDGEAAEAVQKRALTGEAEVETIDKKVKRMPPLLLYDLTELQRHANRLFGFSAKKTLQIAQRLYEKHKVISYPRTDSRHLTGDVAATLNDIVDVIREPYQDKLAAGTGERPLSRRFVNDGRVSDHHAIIPTTTAASLAPGSDEHKIYDLICRRLLSAWHDDYIVSTTTVTTRITTNDNDHPSSPIVDRYRASGSLVDQEGWKVLDPPLRRKKTSDPKEGYRDQVFPQGLREGERPVVDGADILKKQTKPPRPFTEATLLTAMETAGKTLEEKALSDAMRENGLGTPATRAAIIETLLAREYIFRRGKSLVATDKGMQLIARVDDAVKSPVMTGRWERRLKEIERGRDRLDEFMIDIEAYVRKVVGGIGNCTASERHTQTGSTRRQEKGGSGGRVPEEAIRPFVAPRPFVYGVQRAGRVQERHMGRPIVNARAGQLGSTAPAVRDGSNGRCLLTSAGSNRPLTKNDPASKARVENDETTRYQARPSTPDDVPSSPDSDAPPPPEPDMPIDDSYAPAPFYDDAPLLEGDAPPMPAQRPPLERGRGEGHHENGRPDVTKSPRPPFQGGVEAHAHHGSFDKVTAHAHRSSFDKALVPGEPLVDTLRRAFGHDAFRPHQEAVCRTVTAGNSVLLVMPTGAGKSLCYQLPGLARGGTTLVISPLIALMEDQTAALRQKGLRAERIHSGQRLEASREVCRGYLRGDLDFLFIAPERLGVPGFPEMLAKRMPVLIAVDEAHCISHWGHDFRPDYRLMKERLGLLRAAPVIAMTATATPLVQDDIVQQLDMPEAARFIHGFRRTNIGIEVAEMPQRARTEATLKLLRDPARRPAIVYAPTRKKAEALAADLAPSFPAAAYHAGMNAAVRERIQTDFLDGRLEVIVATIAFGMGIDKPNVRTVVHVALPSSIEGYYQEIGRAGRDGEPSRAVLMYAYADTKTHEFFLDRDYPEPSVLSRVYDRLTPHKQPRELLQQLVGLDDDTLGTVLEKLWIHGGADVSPDEAVSRGHKDWQGPYRDQRRHKEEQLALVTAYAQSMECRMLRLVRHFGDQEDRGEPCGQCDICQPASSVTRETRVASPSEQRLMSTLLKELQLSSHQAKGKLYRDLFEAELTRNEYETLVEGLFRAKLITIEQDRFNKGGRIIEFQRLSLTGEGYRMVREGGVASDVNINVVEAPKRKASPKRRKRSASSPTRQTKKRTSKKQAATAAPSPVADKLAAELKAWRLTVARYKHIPAFRILTDRTLYNIAAAHPKTADELLQVTGIGETILRKYGDKILSVCKRV